MTDHIFTPGNYTTRDGRKARVVFRVSEPTGDEFPLKGEMFINGGWLGVSWTANGHHWPKTDMESAADLVPPVRYVWAAVTGCGFRSWWTHLDDALSRTNPCHVVLGILRAEDLEGCGPRRDRPILWLTLEQARKLEAEG